MSTKINIKKKKHKPITKKKKKNYCSYNASWYCSYCSKLKKKKKKDKVANQNGTVDEQ